MNSVTGIDYHQGEALRLRNELFNGSHSLSWAQRPDTVSGESGIARLPAWQWWRIFHRDTTSYKNYLSDNNPGQESTRVKKIKDYLIHRICMSKLSLNYHKRVVDYIYDIQPDSLGYIGSGRLSVAVLTQNQEIHASIQGRDIFKAKYDFSGNCDRISHAIQNFISLDDACCPSQGRMVQCQIAYIPKGKTIATQSSMIYGEVYHAYVLCTIDGTQKLIFDGAVSNYRTDKTVFFGTVEELKEDLRDLLKNKTWSYRLFSPTVRPPCLLPNYQNIMRYCFGDTSVSLHSAANDLFNLWYGTNMHDEHTESDMDMS